jgi:predicted Zn-dependent protease
MKRSIFFMTILLIFSGIAAAQNKTILSAMKDELTRSMEKLKLDKEAGPYYISYLLRDGYSLRISADSGAIIGDSEGRNRLLRIDLRVGSYAQDNSNFASPSLSSSQLTSSMASIPIDDDYDVIRRQIWQVTDRAYKSALETLTKKKAAMQNTLQNENLPDFAKGEATSSLTPEIALQVRRQPCTQLVEQLAKLFLSEPKIQKSKVDLMVQFANTYYINSEGATVVEPFAVTQLTVSASTQAEDGMPLHNFRIFTAKGPEGLPDADKLKAEISTMAGELMAIRSAPLAGEYSGPVLFMGQAAGELFNQGIGSMLGARKLPASDSAQVNMMLSRSVENPFQSKINMKVAANFLSLKDLPTLKNYGGKTLLGSYRVDEEGVLGKDVSLVENGILKNLLTSRAPVKGMEQSNGHSRGGAAIPSVIQVTSTNKKSYAELKQQLIEAVKEEGIEFGYIVRGITPVSEASTDSDIIESLLASRQGSQESSQFRLLKPYLISRIYPDGKEELVRGIEFGSMSINALRNVLATSEDEIVYDYQVSASNALSGLGGIVSLVNAAVGGPNYATVITPSLLISGIDLRKSINRYPKLPIVGSPLR